MLSTLHTGPHAHISKEMNVSLRLRAQKFCSITCQSDITFRKEHKKETWMGRITKIVSRALPIWKGKRAKFFIFDEHNGTVFLCACPFSYFLRLFVLSAMSRYTQSTFLKRSEEKKKTLFEQYIFVCSFSAKIEFTNWIHQSRNFGVGKKNAIFECVRNIDSRLYI